MNCCIVNSITRLVDNTLLLDLGEDIDLVRFHVYLRREEIGEKEELFQIRYQDGDIILDGINGKR